MDEGWVYILVNSSTPGLVKVGRTSRAPRERAAELSGVTGVATPFVVAYEQYFRDCHAAERAIHAQLDGLGCRVAPNREFFRAAASDVIKLLLEAGDTADGTPTTYQGALPDEMEATLLEAGDCALYGLGDALQDTGEAVRCYKLAAARGSAAAGERLGTIYLRLYAAKPDRANFRRAMAPLKEGIRRGNPYCYCTISELFAISAHRDNFEKCWRLFFTQVPRSAAEAARFTAACCRYIGLCLDLQLQPLHEVELGSVSDAILSALLSALDGSGHGSPQRRRCADVLRFAYALALPAAAREAPRPPWQAVGRRWLRGGGGRTALGLPAA